MVSLRRYTLEPPLPQPPWVEIMGRRLDMWRLPYRGRPLRTVMMAFSSGNGVVSLLLGPSGLSTPNEGPWGHEAPHHSTVLVFVPNGVGVVMRTCPFWNRLLPNHVIIVKNHEDDEEDEWASRGRWTGKKMNTSRWRSNPIWNFRVWLRVQLGVQDHIHFKLMYRMCTMSDLDILHMHRKRTR
jgi:hypothetical protein